MNAAAELPWDSLTLLMLSSSFRMTLLVNIVQLLLLSFCSRFARFMNHSAEAVHEPLRATLRVASEKLLEKGGRHDVVQGYSAHWALRDHQQAAFGNMMECLPENAMCVHWEFQEAWMDVSKFPDDGRW